MKSNTSFKKKKGKSIILLLPDVLKIRLGLVSREGEGELTVLCDIVKKKKQEQN